MRGFAANDCLFECCWLLKASRHWRVYRSHTEASSESSSKHNLVF